MELIGNRVSNVYRNYVEQWYKDHNEGAPACFNEWYDNEYTHGYHTEHNRTGDKKRPAEFYTKEFKFGRSSVARRDLEEMPVAMDTYDFTDEDMQTLVELVHENVSKVLGTTKYDLTDDDTSSLWWSELEGIALGMGMNYYEDYDEEIVDGWN